MDLPNRCVVITGGASGLGRATARRLRDEGARVGVIDLKAPCDWNGPSAIADVSDERQLRAAYAALIGELGGLHGVVNCAGGGGSGLAVGPNATLTADRVRGALMVNALGTFMSCQIAATVMAANAPEAEGERGVIVNVSSIVAMEGQLGTLGYAAAKGAINAMTLPMAREFAPLGIRVMTIAPGIFDTAMFNNARGPMVDWLRGQVQFPARPGRPEEFARMVRDIFENRMFNGEILRLDGAYRVPPGDPAFWAG
jgi:3-hydroxyacyl-CoA dehydrogenase/3-hydroxy-2-methylbutyryl-CoA dehydrogenase